MANSNLTEAQRAKNDEFYTQYADIEKEISAYLEFDPDVFRGKTLLLPCDDPEWSNFTKYFAQNFDRFGHDANKSKLWKLNEMDADHVAAWSKGGATELKNCQMLWKTHNRAKGNR